MSNKDILEAIKNNAIAIASMAASVDCSEEPVDIEEHEPEDDIDYENDYIMTLEDIILFQADLMREKGINFTIRDSVILGRMAKAQLNAARRQQ
jgi:hypothetical protein